MHREIELKLRLPSAQSFVRSLAARGIALGTAREQVDRIFMRAGRSFADLSSGEPILRIRESGGTISTTLKVYRSGVSDRVEVGVGISSAEEFTRYLEQLGFVQLVTVAKTRRSGSYGAVTIEVDDVQRLGSFVELEITTSDAGVAAARAALEEAVRALGLERLERVDRPYDEMLYAAGR